MTTGCQALISKLTDPPIVGSWGPTQGSSCPLLMPQGWDVPSLRLTGYVLSPPRTPRAPTFAKEAGAWHLHPET